MRISVSFTVAITVLAGGTALPQDMSHALRPQIVGNWWQIAGDPDLEKYTSEKQQPVDFGIWQAADGTWQLWSCIRHTHCGGKTRLFYRWEGKRLTDAHWTPMGIAMEADPSLGETIGGLQAPHVIKRGGTYWLLNTQYASPNPLNFGVDDDRFLVGTLEVAAPEIIHHEGQYYIAALLPSLKGIRMAKLAWAPAQEQ